MYKSLLFVLAAFILFSGCRIAADIRARNDVEKSKAEYKECLKQHSDDLSKCDALKKIYEADLEYWRSRTGHTGTVTIEDKSKN